MPQRYHPRGRYRGKTLITQYQASREPHYVTSAHLSIVVWKMSASSEGRFVGVSQAETDAFVESMNNPNTKRKTNSDIHIFKEWLITNNETRLPEAIEKQNLDMYLARFWLCTIQKERRI